MRLKQIIFRLPAFLLLLLTMSGLAFSEPLEKVCQRKDRPCIALVLSGGGARGFAHVGVIREIERLRIPIDIVTGTSMGALVGGAYAMGYSPDELENIVLDVDWNKMLVDRPRRELLSIEHKQSDFKGLPARAFHFEKGELRLPEEIFSSQEVDMFFAEKVRPVSHINDLSQLNLPFASVATDLISGKKVVLQKNISLAKAMRSSMSVPGAFSPVNEEGMMLVDGGLVDNLPVDLAREMGADIVIAVNVGTPLFEKDKLTNVVGIMAQMVNLLTEQNVGRSLKSLKNTDILITPDLAEFSSADLKFGKEIIRRGELATTNQLEALKKYALSEQKYATRLEQRENIVRSEFEEKTHQFAAIEITGLQKVNPEKVMRNADLEVDQTVTDTQITEAVERIWSDEDFSTVSYYIKKSSDNADVLVFEPKEKTPNFSSLRIGGSIETDFDTTHTFNLLLAHQWGWLNSQGADWRNELQIGKHKYFLTQFHQPFDAGSNWYAMPFVRYDWMPFDHYIGDQASSRWRNERLNVGLNIGYEIGRIGFVSVGAGYLNLKNKLEIGASSVQEVKGDSPYVAFEGILDTLDDVDFPKTGYYFNLGMSYLGDKGNEAERKVIYYGEMMKPFSYQDWSTILTLKIGTSPQNSTFSLGGVFNLSGSPIGRWSGAKMQLGSIRLMRNVSDIFAFGDMPVWLGTSFEISRAWNENEKTGSSSRAWQKAFSGFVGLDTVIGPIYFVVGNTQGESNGIYLYWGHKH